MRATNDNNGSSHENEVEILDIRVNKAGLESSLMDDIVAGLKKGAGEKTLPTLLLYDDLGLKLFEEITYLDEYYLTNTEIGILEKYAENMAERIEDGGVVIELGSGNLRKVNILLHALDRLGKKITYYALDLDRSELVRTLQLIPAGTFKNVRCVGLHGTYDDGKAWLKSAATANDKSRCILWLGSSAGNFNLSGVSEFLKEWAADALRVGKPDCMLVGLDGCKVAEKVKLAYNDPKGVSREFTLNGLWHANSVMEKEYFVRGEWEFVGEWNAEEGRHQAYYEALKDITFDGALAGVTVKKGEKINVEYSYKFDESESHLLWEHAGLADGARWSNDAGDYCNLDLYMLYKQRFNFPLGPPSLYAPSPTPTVSEWMELWAAWDTVTLGMIPKGRLLTKPIDLRNPCIFYIGHIPAFLDIQISRASDGKMTSPGQKYQDIFERGIDPDVDDPSQCHKHSKIPNYWPELDEILDFSRRVRERTLALYGSDGVARVGSLKLQRALWLAFEHEAMHLETLLYMLIQSEDTLPPPGVVKPDFVSGREWELRRGTNAKNAVKWTEVPKNIISVGIEDHDAHTDNGTATNEGSGYQQRYFGWDNEKPVRHGIEVPGFKVRSHPITNEEYAKYLHAQSSNNIPVSWSFSGPKLNDATPQNGNGTTYQNGDSATHQNQNGTDSSLEHFLSSLSVKTVFGPVPLRLASEWPVMASYDELLGCAKWMGGRIPTANELRALYEYVELLDVAEKTLGRRIDAVNGHLINNGVRESPPNTNPSSIFADMRGNNVGYKFWHPTSVIPSGGAPLGRAATGGAWEWTSTVLERYEGFKEDEMYPEYTADFFDGKHNVMLGGSWATHPRIAGRRSFVNWYQRNYKYTWATARIVALE
ncbi:C-type lectin protein [Morchella snyderi]|nr:C-type lectin protein [Morchella snyderi]